MEIFAPTFSNTTLPTTSSWLVLRYYFELMQVFSRDGEWTHDINSDKKVSSTIILLINNMSYWNIIENINITIQKKTCWVVNYNITDQLSDKAKVIAICIGMIDKWIQ